MLSVNRVIVQTLVFILHMYTCVLHLTMCAMRCVGVRSEKGVWENFHACNGAGVHVAQSFSTRQLSRGQSHGFTGWTWPLTSPSPWVDPRSVHTLHPPLEEEGLFFQQKV